jgi:penicillin-binding protein 1A
MFSKQKEISQFLEVQGEYPMRETDISKFTEREEEVFEYEKPVKRVLKAIGRVLFTVFMVFVAAGIIVGASLAIYVGSIAAEPTGIDLRAKEINQTSFIYVKNSKGNFKKYQALYSTENRVWVDYNEIPKYMGDAVIAIEDKRFNEHHGVDWTRTFGAILNLSSGEASYGGSTLTQQLIKNITDDNEVSLNRKIREIVKALKLETEYTKDEILEAYLNVVNFGSNCQGVQAAANLYFGKNIDKCSIAECAAIAGITQNPSKYNPLYYPENNKERRETVLAEMLEQEKITEDEYNEAMEESANMKFVGYKKSNKKNIKSKVQNWYIDELYYDLQSDLAQYYNISEKAASEKIYTEGLKIYCAMDTDAQEYLENAAQNINKSYDPNMQCAATMVGMDGRIIATVGSSEKKTSNLVFDRATMSTLQPGSSIKPVVVYPYAIEKKKLYYSSVVKDEPLAKYKVVNGQLVSGPNNWYSGYKGNMLLPDAIEWSANATAAQVMNMIYPENAYEQVVTLQGFTHLKEADKVNAGGLSIGGLNGGVTVREMAATFTYMGNGGLYYKPYTYYYVTDADDNIIIDNRDTIPLQSYSQETAYIMNRLLHYNITYCAHTNAAYARVSNWDIIGKTGTTDSDKDSWFCGLSPYASMAVWTGFDSPKTISVTGQRTATTLFSDVMGHYLSDKKSKEYTKPPTIIEANYSPSTGKTYNVGSATDGKYIGYYTEDNMPSGSSTYVDYYSDDYSGSGNSGYSNYSNNSGGSGQTATSASDDGVESGNTTEGTNSQDATQAETQVASQVETAAATVVASQADDNE